ncbi:limonene-1,2-epoxide hydrolase protein [Rhizobium sp. CIAT894]|nr:limonene-1,2-epoxide hydrolase protein [Rhizobium sp. CIAT894]
MSSGTEKNETDHALSIVQGFFDTIDATPEGYWRCFEIYFDSSSVWETIGLGTTVGQEEAIAFAKGFPVKFERMRIEDLVLTGAGNRVHAERLDHFCAADGTIVLTVRASGVFEIEGTTIAKYRDYFDTAGANAAIQKLAA